MSNFISIERLKNAVIRLCDWRGTVKQQSTAHIFPLLALVEKGVNKDSLTQFEESDDFDFFDRYCKVGNDIERPYFDPFSREFRIASHPHSNIATARKNTFQNRWHAAILNIENGTGKWKLTEDFAKIFGQKLFPKSGAGSRINVLDIGCWLFRNEEFSENSTSEAILNRFNERFPMENADFDIVFEYQSEPAENIFSTTATLQSDADSVISELAFENVKTIDLAASHKVEEVNSTYIPLSEDDSILSEVKGLLELGTSGIILRGAPGTGKSWYADQIAMSLTEGNRDRIFRVQFHPSFTYEDFFDGYLPSDETKSGFEITGKVFRQAIEKAKIASGFVVLLIDEINRGNTAKIFGEALTYIEHGWRNVKFTPRLSAEEIYVPSNLIIFATMNPHDRSITPLDMALLRRFDHIDIPPNAEIATDFLILAGMNVNHANLIADWFNALQTLLPFGIGHTFFLNVSDVGKLGLVWRYRIFPFCQSILEYEPQRIEDIKQSYLALERRLRETAEQ